MSKMQASFTLVWQAGEDSYPAGQCSIWTAIFWPVPLFHTLSFYAHPVMKYRIRLRDRMAGKDEYLVWI